jgi:hypothetical protein
MSRRKGRARASRPAPLIHMALNPSAHRLISASSPWVKMVETRRGVAKVSPKPTTAILFEQVEARQPLVRGASRLVISAMASGEGLK